MPKTKWHITLIPLPGEEPSDGHKRRTVVHNAENASTVDVVGGSARIHSRNVALARTLTALPNDERFQEAAARLIRTSGRKPRRKRSM